VDAASLGAAELRAAGAAADTPVEGLADEAGHSTLRQTLLQDLPTLDAVAAEAEVLAAARRLLRRAPQVQQLVLECTNLPPYAAAVARATGLPVHHLMTMVRQRLALLPG
jgi:hypothetical protein